MIAAQAGQPEPADAYGVGLMVATRKPFATRKSSRPRREQYQEFDDSSGDGCVAFERRRPAVQVPRAARGGDEKFIASSVLRRSTWDGKAQERAQPTASSKEHCQLQARRTYKEDWPRQADRKDPRSGRARDVTRMRREEATDADPRGDHEMATRDVRRRLAQLRHRQ